jgi:hypothetical protein
MKRPTWHVAKYRTEYRGWCLEVFRAGDGGWWATCYSPQRSVCASGLEYPFGSIREARSAAERVARKYTAP